VHEKGKYAGEGTWSWRDKKKKKRTDLRRKPGRGCLLPVKLGKAIIWYSS